MASNRVKVLVTYRLTRVAEALLLAEETDEALKVISEALDQGGDTWLLPEAYRLRGELLLQSVEGDDVEQCFSEALNVAQTQGARLFELRAAMSLARLWGDQGKVQQARELLAPVYN